MILLTSITKCCCQSSCKFRYYVNAHRLYEIKLTQEQFLDLHDIKSVNLLKEMKRYPLGDGICLCCFTPVVFQCNKTISYFQLYRRSWEKNLNKTHYQLHSFLRYAVSANEFIKVMRHAQLNNVIHLEDLHKQIIDSKLYTGRPEML